MKKKMLGAALAAVLAAGMVLPATAAKVGDVVGHALYTDIVAQIDGHALRSYNVNGRTAIVAEDLAAYGFQVKWDGVERTLTLNRTTDEQGNPVTPKVYPQYTQHQWKIPVGTPQEEILSTDIVTYLAGRAVSSFNIDGQTLIWLSDLSCCGEVTWDEENRIAGVTLGDEMQRGLDREISQLKDWAGEKADYQLYPGPKGTLFVGYYYGIPHGTACRMIYVDLAGNHTVITNLLPVWGWGAEYYVRPGNILVGEDSLSFTTTFRENWDTEIPDAQWSEQLIGIDLNKMELSEARVLSKDYAQTLSTWRTECQLEQGEQAVPEKSLQITFMRDNATDEVVAVEKSIPFPEIKVEMTQSRLFLNLGKTTTPDYLNTPYGKAYYALAKSDIPSMLRDEKNFNPVNTEQQRKFVYNLLQVKVDGKPVTGNLSWVGRSGDKCLIYAFDRAQKLNADSVVTIKLGSGK